MTDLAAALAGGGEPVIGVAAVAGDPVFVFDAVHFPALGQPAQGTIDRGPADTVVLLLHGCIDFGRTERVRRNFNRP